MENSNEVTRSEIVDFLEDIHGEIMETRSLCEVITAYIEDCHGDMTAEQAETAISVLYTTTTKLKKLDKDISGIMEKIYHGKAA